MRRVLILGAGFGVALAVATFGTDEVARPGGESAEAYPVFLMCLLDTGCLEVLQDHLREGLPLLVAGAGFRQAVDQFVGLVDS